MQEDNLSDITLTPRIPTVEDNPFIPMAQKMAQPDQLGLNAPEDNPFLAIAKGMGGTSQPPAIGSIASTLSINPDQAAQASKLGGQFGLGQDIALRNMDELRRRSLITRLQQTGMLDKNPALAESFANPAFAAQAHDDIDNLAETGSWIDSIAKGWEGGWRTGEEGTLRYSPLSGAVYYGSDPLRDARIAFVRERQRETAGSGVLYMTSQVASQMAYQAPEIATFGLGGAAIGGSFGGPAGAAVGFGAGLKAGMVASTAKMEAGVAYGNLVEQGVDPDEAAYWAAGIGGINGMIELAGTKVLQKTLSPFINWAMSKAIRQVATQALVQPTVAGALTTAGKLYGLEMMMNGVEESSQDIVGILGEELAKLSDGIESEVTLSDAASRIADAFVAGVQGSVLLGAIGPGARLAYDTRRARQTQAQQQWLDGLQERVAKPKLRERNPNAFQEFVETQVEGKPVATIYVDAEEAKGVLAQLNLTVSQVDAIVPGFAEQVRTEAERGGDVTIPTAVFSAKLANTEFGNALRPHMRLSPEALSVTQLEAVRAERERMSAAGQDVIDERLAAEDTAFVESATRVEETMYSELTAAGQPATEAKINAEFVRNMMASLADRVGVTPEQMFERYPYRVRGDGQAEQAQALEQAVTPAPESGVFDVNNPPVAKPGMRPLSDGPAIVALMDYDGTVYYDVNATMHGDLIDTFPEIADTVIDGGFIIDGKYVMNASDGGYAAAEGGSERTAEVRRFTNQVNTRKAQRPLAQGSRIDADYMAAVERGDMETAQRMVDEAAKARGMMFRGHKRNRPQGVTETFVSESREQAQQFANQHSDGVVSLVRFTKPLRVYEQLIPWQEYQDSWRNSVLLKGYDAVRVIEPNGQDTSLAIRNQESIGFESADPVTYDESGNVVPLSRRFNLASPMVFEQAAMPTRNLGPIEAAKAIVQETGREAFTDADEFFKKRWDALLKKTKRQVKPSPRNFREAAKRAVADILDFVKNNPKFADYYANDWKATRSILDDYIGRAITDDEFAMFRTIAGLTSPNTMLPSNISDTVGLWDHWMREGNFDAFTLGPKPGTGALVVFEAAESISGTTANVKVRTIRIVERLIKERGGVTQALEYLQEGVPVKELHKFNRKMGYSGAVGDIGNITDLVQQATGQSKLIPRMFIFGQKVGAYTLNAIGDERYTTVDIWESRYIRSHFTGMFDVNIGLPESIDEHQIFTRFGDLFKEEMEAVTGRKWAPSALQALRWFYIIGSAREAGYSKASTNETISFYTERRLVQAFGYPGRAATGGGQGAGTAALGGAAGQVRAARLPPKRFERNLETDVAKLDNPDQRRRAIASGYVRYARYNSELGQRGFSFDERRGGPARQHGILNATIAADFVPGERFQSAFGKANLPLQTMQELVADADGAQAFRSLVAATNALNPYGAAVAVYTAEEYQGKRLFVTEDATAGFALSADGDIVSVFSAPKSGNGRAVMALAVQVGGRRLDCFDTALPGYYAAHGFRAVARLAWNDEYAPTGWNKDTFKDFNDGRPDVVFMVYERGYNGEYKAGDGATAGDYDAGLQAQARALQAIAKSQQFQQAARGLARGGFDPQKLLTTLNKDADFSTFAHETAHYFLTILGDVAARPDAPASVLDDMNTLLRWFGVKDLATWNAMSLDQQRQYHEQFAYSFETYLFEGKAPSVEMQGLFDQFARWLKQVYQGLITKINDVYKAEFGKDLPILTGEVRQVMDRMLATEDQIARAQAIREMKPQFQTQEQSRMDDAAWAAYQELQEQATERAVAELTTATLKEMAWMSRARGRKLRELQRQHDDKRKEIKDEVAEDLRILPVYRAMEFLKRGKVVDVDGTTKPATGQFKLSLAGVQAVMPPGFDVAILGRGRYGMVNEDGLHPDLIAPLYGYANGAELVTALSTAKPFADAVAERTDQRMLSEFSELADPAARSLAVDRAIHNEARARLIAVEQRWADKLQQPVSVIMEAASQVAGEVIGRQTIRTLSPRAYAAAEARAARLATSAYSEPQSPEQAGQTAATRAYNAAIAAGKTVEEATAESLSAGVAAVETARQRRADFDAKYGGKSPAEVMMRAKRQQLLQNMLARQALEARAEIDRARSAFKRFFGSDEKIAKTRNMEMVSAARAILGWYGFGKRDKSPAEYVDQLRAYNPAAYAQLEPLILRATKGPQDYRDLTVDEFRVLRDTVDGLWIQARKDKQVKLADRTMALDEVVGELDQRLEEIGVPKVVAGEKRAPTFRDRAARNLMTLRSTMRRVESWADAMDGVSTVRPFTNYLVRPVLDAVDKFTASRNKYMKRFRDLVVNLQMPEGTIAAPELDYTFGAGNAGIGKAELLGALLHTGNASNYRKLLLGRGWGQEDEFGNLDDTQFKAFVKRMQDEGVLTKADYDFLQSVWDLNEDIKPIAQKAHYELYGFYFTEIPASEVVTPFGTYRGGYVPAATDKFMVADAAQRAGEEELESDWRNSLPSTGRGFTQTRMAGYNKALSLDVRVIGAHIDAALRFSMIQPAITQALRILRSREFAARLDRVDPTVKQELLIPWLNRTARQLVSQPGKYKAVDTFWRGVRTRTGMSIMFANLRNAMQQVTGLFPAGVKVQPRYLTAALTEYVGSPQRTANSVAALSPFMEDRLKGQSFEVQEQINEVLLNPSRFDKAQAWTDRHGYFLQQAFQNMVDVVTWVGAYNQSLSTTDTTVTAEEAQREAIAAGDAAVRLTQGSVRPSDVSAFESGTPFFRTLTQFAGYFNMLANLNATEYVKVIRDMGFRGNKGKLVYIYMMGFMLPAVVADAIVRTLGGGWEDEDEDGYLDVFMDWFFGSQIRQGVAFVPFGTTAYTLATTAFDDKPYNDRMTTSPSVASLEAATVGVGKAAIAVVDEEKDVTGKNVRDVLTLLSLATGIPFSVLGRPAGYLVDVQRGEVEPTSTYDMIRGTITGTATPESKR